MDHVGNSTPDEHQANGAAWSPTKGWLTCDAEALTVFAVLGSVAIVALGSQLGLISSDHPSVQVLTRAGRIVRETMIWAMTLG